MQEQRLFDAEFKFMSLIWEHEPLPSGDLVAICREKLGWKKSTTYTVLRKLCDRGYLKNENALVSALLKKDDAQRHESQTVMQKAFNGSLPAFVAAFLKDKTLTVQEADELKQLIEHATQASPDTDGVDG